MQLGIASPATMAVSRGRCWWRRLTTGSIRLMRARSAHDRSYTTGCKLASALFASAAANEHQ